MDDLFKDIFPALLGVAFCAWWWFIAKNAASRKYIILLGICWLVLGISYNVMKLFDTTALRGVMGMIGVFAFLGMIYFLIRAALSERKTKKKPPG